MLELTDVIYEGCACVLELRAGIFEPPHSFHFSKAPGAQREKEERNPVGFCRQRRTLARTIHTYRIKLGPERRKYLCKVIVKKKERIKEVLRKFRAKVGSGVLFM
eukprot:TRINITY_DN12442_c0_g1_i2.p1 TRINITY_DN12442_c0_g1~~TRINITY_DN12442_c0_g1_i2.p1  ORF type:complete len:105 (+),score=20.89 TRINITY_DN12442_c0_g1_i2:1-315(+)